MDNAYFAENKRRRSWMLLICAVILLLSAGYLIFTNIPPVTLSWETASEVGTAGFNVYRSDIDSEQFKLINAVMIPAEGDEVLGSTYEYKDHNVKPTQRYLYRIEEVEWDGSTQLYPETEMVRAGLTRVWRQLEGAALCVLSIVLFGQGIQKK